MLRKTDAGELKLIHESEEALVFTFREEDLDCMSYVVIANNQSLAWNTFVKVTGFAGTEDFVNGRYEISNDGHMLDGNVEIIVENQEAGWDSAIAMATIAMYGTHDQVVKVFDFLSHKWI